MYVCTHDIVCKLNYNHPIYICIQFNCKGHHNGDIRLVPTTNDSAVHSGSIEVFYITQWYPVSGQGWNLLAAQVVCRQLGYSGAKSAGNGRVWYGRAWSFSRCRGLESNLFSCRRRSSVSTRHQLAECTCMWIL